MWRNEPLLYLICGKLIQESQAVIHPLACVFRLQFIVCRRGIKLGGQMCQRSSSPRPLSQKSYDGQDADRGGIHARCGNRKVRTRQPSGATGRVRNEEGQQENERYPGSKH